MNERVEFIISATDQASAVIGRIRSNLGRLSSFVGGLGSKLRGFLGGIYGIFRNVLGMVVNLGQKLLWVAGIAAGALTAAVGKMVQLAGRFESAMVGFTTMLGSGAKAKQFLETLQAFADVTPFELEDLVKASQRLLAFGFSSGSILPMLTAVGDAVSGLGGGAYEIEHVIRALGQMRAKGKVSAEEMMQLAEIGIPAWEILAKRIGTDIPKAMKLAERGTLSAETGVEAIVAGMEEKFPGMMNKMASTLQGRWSTLMDSIGRISRRIGEKFLPVVKGIIGGFDAIIRKFEASGAIEKIGAWIDKTFSRENILKAAVFFANLVVWAKDGFEWLRSIADKSIRWVGNMFIWLANLIGAEGGLFGVLKKLTRYFITFQIFMTSLGWLKAWLSIAEVASRVPGIGIPLAAGAITTGLTGMAGINSLGNDFVNKLSASVGQVFDKLQIPKPPPMPKWGEPARSPAGEWISTFMEGYDRTTRGGLLPQVIDSLQTTATNTGKLVQQNDELLSKIYGGGPRTDLAMQRMQFGGGAQGGGHVSVDLRGLSGPEARASEEAVHQVLTALRVPHSIRATA